MSHISILPPSEKRLFDLPAKFTKDVRWFFISCRWAYTRTLTSINNMIIHPWYPIAIDYHPGWYHALNQTRVLWQVLLYFLIFRLVNNVFRNASSITRFNVQPDSNACFFASESCIGMQHHYVKIIKALTPLPLHVLDIHANAMPKCCSLTPPISFRLKAWFLPIKNGV